MRARVHLASALREHAGGCREVDVDVPDGIPPTLAAVLDDLAARFPTLGHRLRDEQGRLRPHVNVFVGSENARDLGGVDAALPDGAEISVLPAVSGGAGRHGPPGEAFGACG